MMWVALSPDSRGKYSIVAFCSGAIAGLVAITHASGYVGPPAAVLYGFMAGTACKFADILPAKLGIDDSVGVSLHSGHLPGVWQVCTKLRILICLDFVRPLHPTPLVA